MLHIHIGTVLDKFSYHLMIVNVISAIILCIAIFLTFSSIQFESQCRSASTVLCICCIYIPFVSHVGANPNQSLLNLQQWLDAITSSIATGCLVTRANGARLQGYITISNEMNKSDFLLSSVDRQYGGLSVWATSLPSLQALLCPWAGTGTVTMCDIPCGPFI